MSRPKKHEKEANHERWLVSYADFITLLFAVFVTLYAMSQADQKKVQALVSSLRESFGYVKTGASSEKVTVIETTDLRTIPAIHPETLTPGGGGTDAGKGKKRNQANMKEFMEIKAAIDKALKKDGSQDKVSVE